MKKVFVILFLFNILLYSKTLDELLFSAVEDNNIKKVQSYLEQGANCNALDSYDRTALMNASVSGYNDIAKLLIEEGTDVNIRDKAGATALMYTARDTNYEMVEFLLKNGADVNIRDTEGDTALYYSIEHNSRGQKNETENAIKILNLLIKYGADVNTKNDKGTSLLDVSYRISESFDKNKEMFKILVENGFDLESRIKADRSDYDYTPLMIAVYKKDYDMVKYLLDKGANPNTANNEKKTALMIAIANNNFDISKLLIQQGANINTKDEYGYTALMRAAMIGSYEMVKFLLENGANINTKDNDGNTVLYYNIYYAGYGEEERLENAKKIFNLLIKYGADVNTKNNYGASLLNISYRASTALVQNREMFKVLVENGFDLESRIDGGEHSPDDYDYTPLMIAAAINDYDMVKFLVEKGADVNAKTHSEYSSVETPLLLSLDYEHIESRYDENSSVAEYLINNGADINVTNEDGETPLMYASKLHNIKVIELLIQKGADINAFNNYGNTALIYGVNNLETVKLLVENGADVNFYKGGSTALISACEYSHERNIDVIKYLVSKNANINAQDNKGDTALNKTLDTSDEGSIDILDFEIANFLIEQGADVNIKNKREYTPFIYLGMGEGNFNNKSFQEYRIKLAEVLLEKGADINAKDYNGYTSLMWACASSGSRFAEPYVKFLVEKGADINIEDNHGDTALDIAENLKLRKIVSILKKAQRAQRNRN
ncbi:ankyrin repeat-containing protein [Brachyspira pilosicoli P43/6/78]|uniref:Ankyrin repeat-containing protein n=2 Tax=Brachyspira pilosicoli TaxID=52584 RepID=A0A3B6VP09_BRAPL|nr:ankyrin repeat domain-containing protein [Brachyspira pilosicoli]AGA67448.1 ankyrin repeat-containing protein [Brachyspira pilosicoli P43/6/78]